MALVAVASWGCGSVASDGDDAGPSCPLTTCGEACVDTDTDPANCGGCGNACDPGFVCASGSCELTCQEGRIACDGGCVDPDTDESYCGASGDCSGANAGVACAGGEVCDGAGQCAVTCQEGLVECAGTCIDPDSNPTYCGASGDCGGASAGVACTGNQACVSGVCSDLAVPFSCKEVLDYGLSTGDGVYQIDIDGPGPAPTTDVYCDMTTDGGGWTLIVLTNGNVDGHPNAAFADAKNAVMNVNGTFSSDLDAFDYFMGTNFWNLAGGGNQQMMWRVGNSAADVLDVVVADFNVYGGGERIHWENLSALQGGIPNIVYQNDGYLQAKDEAAAGSPLACVVETQASVGLHGPWFYTNCSNASPWCTGHGDCNGLPIRMQWRNQGSYTTATAPSCSNHGEIYVR